MKAAVLSSGALLLALSNLGVAFPQEPSNTVIPLPTVVPPSGLTSIPISLTVQTSRTRTRTESESGLPTTGTLTTPITTSESAAPTETSSVPLPLTSGTTPRASSQTPSSPATVVTSSAGASASTSPNAAPMQFGPWKAQGVAVLGAATTVFAAMLFAL